MSSLPTELMFRCWLLFCIVAGLHPPLDGFAVVASAGAALPFVIVETGDDTGGPSASVSTSTRRVGASPSKTETPQTSDATTSPTATIVTTHPATVSSARPAEDVVAGGLPDVTVQLDSSTNTAIAERRGDEIFLLSVRDQPSGLCSVRLPVDPVVYRLDRCGRRTPSSMEDYQRTLLQHHPTVLYVHGNRYTAADAIEYGLYVYHRTVTRIPEKVVWVIWSWPADRYGLLGKDVREKARRTDGQAFLLADLLRQHAATTAPTTLIGFSFGGRVITGALHALAGGAIRGVVPPGQPLRGAGFSVGLIAPAIEQNWLAGNGYHRLATKNMDQLTVLYNQRDIVLKRYWLIDRVRGQEALGYTGPKRFAPRNDGSKLPVRSRDCARFVGLQHDETDYYGNECRGGQEMARLIRRTIAESTRQTSEPESNVLFRRPMLSPTIQ